MAIRNPGISLDSSGFQLAIGFIAKLNISVAVLVTNYALIPFHRLLVALAPPMTNLERGIF